MNPEIRRKGEHGHQEPLTLPESHPTLWQVALKGLVVASTSSAKTWERSALAAEKSAKGWEERCVPLQFRV